MQSEENIIRLTFFFSTCCSTAKRTGSTDGQQHTVTMLNFVDNEIAACSYEEIHLSDKPSAILKSPPRPMANNQTPGITRKSGSS